MSNLIPSIQQFFEPVSRAIRRGDEQQMTRLVDSLAKLWKDTKPAERKEAAQAQGMTAALEGVLSFALARSRGDAQYTLLTGRKYGLPVLHALAKQARAAALPKSSKASQAIVTEYMTLSELARSVGAKAQNLSSLIDEMEECGLLKSTYRGVARYLSISEPAIALLEAMSPGWQAYAVSVNADVDRAWVRAESLATHTILKTYKHTRVILGSSDIVCGSLGNLFSEGHSSSSSSRSTRIKSLQSVHRSASNCYVWTTEGPQSSVEKRKDLSGGVSFVNRLAAVGGG
jgi:hypothetical protein